ncbi:hypothetical protein [Shimia sp. SDUM112013]|uniref:hypothetical protein n=1 Tax=Shimia sp. SDUM112013 TaxID=3136160 RepID=UPI0032ED07B8
MLRGILPRQDLPFGNHRYHFVRPKVLAISGSAISVKNDLETRRLQTVQINISVEDPTSDDGRGSVSVGWFFLEGTNAKVIYDSPKRVRTSDRSAPHAKSASRCPAVLNFESRLFEIKCPVDVAVSFVRGEDGQAELHAAGGPQSSIRRNRLAQLVHLSDEAEWRHPDRPVLQLALPYVFVADAPVVINQLAPFLHYRAEALPGTMFAGRFPIHVWPRPIMWSFEWHDTDKPLVIKRGEPLFYVQFETIPQERPVQLVEAELTPELQAYLDLISGTVDYVSQTFSLMQAAADQRPAQLVSPKRRK